LFGYSRVAKKITPEFPERASKCLDVTDGSLQDGARLQIYSCFDDEGNIAQHYRMS